MDWRCPRTGVQIPTCLGLCCGSLAPPTSSLPPMGILSPLWDSAPNKHFFPFSAPHATTTLPRPAEARRRPPDFSAPSHVQHWLVPQFDSEARYLEGHREAASPQARLPSRPSNFRSSPRSVPSYYSCLTARQSRRGRGQAAQGSISATSSRQVTSAGCEVSARQ